MKVIFSFLIIFTASMAQAQTHVARIVKMENDGTVYVPADDKAGKNEKLVKYLDRIFKIVPAEKGMKLDNGYVVTTGPQSKIKIVFNNGDHFFVAPNTQYYIEWKRQHLKDEDPSTMNILRGAVRGLVEKGGPRSGMQVVTKNTVMGVRGTDFHVSHLNSGSTQISVLRGEIDLKSPKKEDVKIQSGQTYVTKEANSQLSQLTKSELKTIAQEATIKTADVKEPELVALEKKAASTTLNDIKEYQPQLFEKVKNSKNIDSDSLALTTVEKLQETAPEKKKKPDWAEMIDDRDPYDTYKPKNN